MRRRHAAVASLAIGIAALIGTFAVTRTAALGQQSSQPTSAGLAARTAQLDAAQARLDRIRILRPPALPAATAAWTQAGSAQAVPAVTAPGTQDDAGDEDDPGERDDDAGSDLTEHGGEDEDGWDD